MGYSYKLPMTIKRNGVDAFLLKPLVRIGKFRISTSNSAYIGFGLGRPNARTLHLQLGKLSVFFMRLR